MHRKRNHVQPLEVIQIVSEAEEAEIAKRDDSQRNSSSSLQKLTILKIMCLLFHVVSKSLILLLIQLEI